MVEYRVVRRTPPAEGVYILRLPDHQPHILGRDVSESEAKKIAAALNKEAKAMAKKTKKKAGKKRAKKRTAKRKAPKRRAKKTGKKRSSKRKAPARKRAKKAGKKRAKKPSKKKTARSGLSIKAPPKSSSFAV